MLYSRTAAIGLSLAILAASPSTAFALAGLVSRPALPISARQKVDGEAVNKVLANPKYKYVSGLFINFSTSLYYSGTSEDLSDFVSDLAAIKGVKVSVRYSRKRGIVDTTWFGKQGKRAPCQWMLGHTPGVFGITVFLGDGKIKKADVELPAGVEHYDEPAPARPAKPEPK